MLVKQTPSNPPAPWATRLRGFFCQHVACSHCILAPCSLAVPAVLHLKGCILQQTGCKMLPASARGSAFSPPLTMSPRSGVPQGSSQNTSKSQPESRTLPNHPNAPPGTQKASKMRSQSVPEDTHIANKPKSRDLTKTAVFTMV